MHVKHPVRVELRGFRAAVIGRGWEPTCGDPLALEGGRRSAHIEMEQCISSQHSGDHQYESKGSRHMAYSVHLITD